MSTLTKPDELRAQYSEKQCDLWMMTGYRHWLKGQLKMTQKGQSVSTIRRLNSQIKELSPDQLKSIIRKIK